MERLVDPRASFEIRGFTPPGPPHDTQGGGWGFEIALSLNFARRCARTVLSLERLERRCRTLVLERTFDKDYLEIFRVPVIRPFEDTMLALSFEVPGVNGAWLAITDHNMSDIRKGSAPGDIHDSDAILYTTHNIDNMEQATALLSCWLHWHRGACVFFNSHNTMTTRSSL